MEREDYVRAVIKLLIIISALLITFMLSWQFTPRLQIDDIEKLGVINGEYSVLKQADVDSLNAGLEKKFLLLMAANFIVFLVMLSTLIFSITDMLKLSGRAEKNSDLEFEEEGLMEESLMDDDISAHADMLGEDRMEGVLAHSYHKMVEALQKINDLEKEHSIELALGNERLQKEITERKGAEKEIRHLSSRLLSGIEEARKDLAQDLHDEFGQMLAALHLNAEALWNSMPDNMDEQKKNIGSLIDLIEQLGDKIRNISSNLRPDLLDDLGLVPTLEWYINEFMSKRDDINIEFMAVGSRKRLSSNLELVLYRIFQEGLNNIVKHAKASNVNVTLTYSYPKVIFIVKDNGVGFDQTILTDGIGLLGMRERVVSVNGTIAIVSGKSKKGTTIRVELPVT
ncbi:sensor histidine kinase [Desulfobacterales bacterium HSG16]|nr:sensor histidine kinase [Desulfobacterales bacterium HSG16]